MKKFILFLSCVICAMAVSSVAYAQKKKKEAKDPRSTFEILEDLKSAWKPTGNADFDVFIRSTISMAESFKTMSDEYQNIKIEAVEIPDAGDGVTTAVKITDAQGNTRTKDAVVQSNLNTVGNVTKLTADATLMVASGASMVQDIAANPAKALPLAFGIKQMKLAIEALGAMKNEIPVFVENVKAQNEALRQAKSI